MTPNKNLAPVRRDASLLLLGVAIAATLIAGYLAKRPEREGSVRPSVPRGTFWFQVVGQGVGGAPFPGAPKAAAWVATIPQWNGRPEDNQQGIFHTEGRDAAGNLVEIRSAWSGGKYYFMAEPGYGHASGLIRVVASNGRGEGTVQMAPLPDEVPSFESKAQPITLPGVRAELRRTGFTRRGKRDATMLELRLTHQLRDDEQLLVRYEGTPLRPNWRSPDLYRWVGPRGSKPGLITFRFEEMYLDRASAAKFELVRLRSVPVRRKLTFRLREMENEMLTAEGTDPIWNVSVARRSDPSGYWVTLDAKPNPKWPEFDPIFDSAEFRLVSPSRIRRLPAALQVSATFARYDHNRMIPPAPSDSGDASIVCETEVRQFRVVDRCETVIPFTYKDLPSSPTGRDLTWDVVLIDGGLYHRRGG